MVGRVEPQQLFGVTIADTATGSLTNPSRYLLVGSVVLDSHPELDPDVADRS